MRKQREEKVIEHSDKVLNELRILYKEGIGITEFEQLLNEYKKLFKRYQKTMKQSDIMSSEIIHNNDNLKDNLDYTIKTARNKLMYNVSEHRKTKESINYYIERIKKLENHIQYLICLKEIDKKDSKSEDYKILENINPEEYTNIKFENILENSIKLLSNSSNIIVAKIRLENFRKIVENCATRNNLRDFLKGIFRYFKNNLTKDSVIYHNSNEEFFIISTEFSVNDLTKKIEKLSFVREIMGNQINFFCGLVQYSHELSIDYILIRCEEVLKEAEKNNIKVLVK